MTATKKQLTQYFDGYELGRARIEKSISIPMTRGKMLRAIIHPAMKFNNTHSTAFRNGYRDGYNDCLETLRMD